MSIKQLLLPFVLIFSLLSICGCGEPVSTEWAPPDKASQVMDGVKPFADEAEAMSKFNADPTEKNRKRLALIRETYALNYALAGEKESNNEMLQTALLYAESAAHLEPNNDKYWLLTGQLFLKMRGSVVAIASAADCFRRAIELNSENLEAMVLLGQTQLTFEMYPEALDSFEDAINKDRKIANPKVISAMTVCYIMDKNEPRGVKFFTSLLKKDPTIDTARISLAILLGNQKKTDLAIGELKKVDAREGASEANRSYARKLISMLEENKGG